MFRTWKKLLALTMTVCLLAASCGMPQGQSSVYASESQTETKTLTSEKTAMNQAVGYTKEKESISEKASSASQNLTINAEKTDSGATDSYDKNSEEDAGADKNSNEKDSDKKDATETGSEAKDSEKSAADQDSSQKDSSEEKSDKSGTDTGDKAESDTDQSRKEESDSGDKEISDSDKEEDSEQKEEASDTGEDGSSAESPDDSLTNLAEDADTEEELNSLEAEEAISLLSTGGPHDVDMPDVTSHYFLLQKNSKKLSAASGSNLKVVSDVKAASRYISQELPNGNLYSFTPRMTSASTVTVGGGEGGGIALTTVTASDRAQFGDLYDVACNGNIQSKAFNLDRCNSNPYALYTNVGTWYDSTAKKTYSVDMKLIVTGYLFPSEDIREQQYNVYKGPYVGFHKKIIGLVAMGTDYVQTRMIFYYHGTSTEISNLHGVIQFCDIDAQQGVDIGSGFQKIIMFNTSGSHLQYNATGLMTNSLGYISSRIVDNITTGDSKTTALALFSGSTVNCRWTLAKCDHKDTGGSAAYAVSAGYGIPADSSQADARSYYYSNSTGFLGIYADLGLIPLPPATEKNEYQGDIDASKSTLNQKELKLDDREDKLTFVLSAAAASPSDINQASYTSFCFKDSLEAAFAVNAGDIRVYTEESLTDSRNSYSDVSTYFDITAKEQTDHTTLIEVSAKAAQLARSIFYGRTYYVHIPVRIRTEDELSAYGLSLSDWYQTDNDLGQEIGSGQSYQGLIAMGNSSQLYVVTNQGTNISLTSPTTGTQLPIRILLRKTGDHADSPVEGVTFALYGGAAETYTEDSKPIMTAVSDKDGYVCFESEDGTFYDSSYGDGPYHIREIAIPDQYKDVWKPAVQKNWTYTIESLSDISLLTPLTIQKSRLADKDDSVRDRILQNTPHNVPEKAVEVYKKSSDTGELLSGAEFLLYEWSEKDQSYHKLMKLTQGLDAKGQIYYYNATAFENTLDNLGHYKVEESKAPQGCILSADAWTFTFDEESEKVSYTFKNALQKVLLEIEKEGEAEEKLSGVVFQIKAAEDIYAPWAEGDSGDEADSALLVKKGTLVDTVTTDEDGVARSTDGQELYVGPYLIEEIEGADGYIMDTEPHKVTLHYEEEVKKLTTTYRTTISNKKMQPSMAVAKLADHTLNEAGQEVAYDQKTGRYTEKKIAGSYKGQEWIDYTITVSNTGNVDLYEIRLEDSMDEIVEDGYALKDFILEDSAGFDIPKAGYYLSDSDKKVMVSYEQDDPMVLLLDQLAVGDSVQVHFLAQVKKDAANAYDLINKVVLTARYAKKEGLDVEQDLIDVPTEDLLDEDGNPLNEDWDAVNIPGEAEARVAKLADKTSGAKLTDGRYEGQKMEGTYEYGDDVDFTITVTNSGTADLFQIKVEDTLDKSLSEALDPDSIVFAEGSYTSIKGEEIHAIAEETEESGSYALLLDYLLAGDSVELHLYGRVKSGSVSAHSLKNTVRISAEYQTGRDRFEELPYTPEMEDQDTIGIGVPLLALAKVADKTTGVSLKQGRYSGNKKSGSYAAGDTVRYTLTLSNLGDGGASDITVREKPSEQLLKYVSVIGYQLTAGDSITTREGNIAYVTKVEGYNLTIDQLAAGDSLQLIYECKVKQNIVTIDSLLNTAKLSGKNKDGSKIPDRPEMTDDDQIRLKKAATVTPSSGTSTYSSSNPKTGDDTQTALPLLLAGIALMGLAYGAWRRKKIRP